MPVASSGVPASLLLPNDGRQVKITGEFISLSCLSFDGYILLSLFFSLGILQVSSGECGVHPFYALHSLWLPRSVDI